MMKTQMTPARLTGIMLSVALLASCSPIPGGYSSASTTNPQVIAAANFAIKEQEKAHEKNKATPAAKLSLVSILKARQQVVQGWNYDLRLKVSMDGKDRTVDATVWSRPWQKEAPYKLTSWEWR